jgi:hypothetical protein
VAVVVGLAIADMATSLHRLLRNRSRVKWDWVAPLSAVLILVELFNAWWEWRGFTGTTLGEVIPYFVALILIFLAASVTLPDEVPAEGLDLGRYFDENRSYFMAVYAAYVAAIVTLLTIRDLGRGLSAEQVFGKHYFDYPSVIVYLAMIFVRPRWISGAVMLTTLIWLIWGFDWWHRAPATPL